MLNAAMGLLLFGLACVSWQMASAWRAESIPMFWRSPVYLVANLSFIVGVILLLLDMR